MTEKIAAGIGVVLAIAAIAAIIGQEGIVELWQMLVGIE